MEKARNVSHDTALIGTKCIAKIFHIEELLKFQTVSVMSAGAPRWTHRNPKMLGGYLKCKASILVAFRLL
jgi:hypothetical protein